MPGADQHHAELRAYLADRDVPCPGCGYNLRGLLEQWCPECNAPVSIGVIERKATRPRVRLVGTALYWANLMSVGAMYLVSFWAMMMFSPFAGARAFAVSPYPESVRAIGWAAVTVLIASTGCIFLLVRGTKQRLRRHARAWILINPITIIGLLYAIATLSHVGFVWYLER